jgi:hypothetical protein
VLATRVQTLAPAADDVLVVARIDDARLALAAGRTEQLIDPFEEATPTYCGSHHYKALFLCTQK